MCSDLFTTPTSVVERVLDVPCLPQIRLSACRSVREMTHVDPQQERLYMPSNWVVRVAVDQAVPLHVKEVTEESRRVRRLVEDRRLGVKYGPGEGDRLDMFGLETCTTTKLMVFISGGYWQEMSGQISCFTVMVRVTSVTSLVVNVVAAKSL